MQPIYNDFNIIEFHKEDKIYYKFKEDLIKDIPGIFSYCQNNVDLRSDLQDSGVLLPEENFWKHEQDNVIVFNNYQSAKDFVERLNKYIKRMFALL